MPFIVGSYGNDCESVNFAQSDTLEGLASFLIDRSETAFDSVVCYSDDYYDDSDSDEYDSKDSEEKTTYTLEEIEEEYRCNFDDYRKLKDGTGGLETVIKKYCFQLSDMYCNVSCFASDGNYEELAALLKDENIAFNENASYQELERLFLNLENQYSDW